jgi:DNA-binding NtrC family response regulator
LARYFVATFAARSNKKITHITEQYLAFLKNNIWKGNIRELKNIIERSVILTEQDPIDIDSLPIDMQQKPIESGPNTVLSAFDLSSVERLHIQKVMNYTNGNKSEAARLLNIAITTLYRKLDEYKIQ